ncbi:sigma-54-dependent transcriptional regulator [Thermodesulfobacteriota bacterium]
MGKQRKLEPHIRDFFALVYEAILANPFDDARADVDLKLSGLPPTTSRKNRLEKAIHKIRKRIDLIEAGGPSDIDTFGGKDRQLVQAAYLFDFFYRYREQFDKLITDQIAAGDNFIKVPFANDAFLFLRKKGFTGESTTRYFALSYQLRRAYYFMTRRLVGPSNAMKKLRFDLWNNVFTHNIDFYEKHLLNRMEDFSTLILGETGTGKGTAAMAIGCSGFIPFYLKKKGFQESFTKSFVSINLSQFPETLIESELFGHKKGAFTGAVKHHTGVFGRCSPYGAILLDEIGETSTQLQIKLLEVLQSRVFSPVGSHEKSRFEGRVIAATNRAIHEIRGKNIFRDDFYYRLSSDIITVPPLRIRIQQNPDELNALLSYTIERMLGQPSPELEKGIRTVIDKNLGPDYAWPGNVRELEQCVRRVVLKKNYAGDIKSILPDDLKTRLVKGIESGELDAQNLIAGYCTLLYNRYGTFEDVARHTNLDRRTVKKYIGEWEKA